MLVKYNLSNHYKLSKSNIDYYKEGEGYVEVDNGVIRAKAISRNVNIFNKPYKLHEGQNISISLVIENIGKDKIDVVANTWRGRMNVRPGEKKICKFNLISNQYVVIQAQEGTEIKFKAYNFIVNLGDALSDVYLPNINALPQDKQHLLPPEGEYKEIQPR